jgi:hypothetical protein
MLLFEVVVGTWRSRRGARFTRVEISASKVEEQAGEEALVLEEA